MYIHPDLAFLSKNGLKPCKIPLQKKHLAHVTGINMINTLSKILWIRVTR